MHKIIILLSLLSCVLIGCWDRVEIEDRGFVIGIAIDMVESEKKEYELTYQVVVPKALKGGGGQGPGGQQGAKAFVNVNAKGETMFEIARSLSTKTSRTPFFEHLKSIIVSEKVAKTEDFTKFLDFFMRDHEMRSGIKVIIAKGDAKKILEVEPKNEAIPTQYIVSISENDFKTAKMPTSTRIGDVFEKLHENKSFVLQYIKKGKDEVSMTGAVVISGDQKKMIGILNEEETEGLKFLLNETLGGTIKFEMNGGKMVYEIGRAKAKIIANLDDKNQLKFKFEIGTEGFLGESLSDVDFKDRKLLKSIQQKVADEIESICTTTIAKAQKELKVDIMELGEYIENNNWKLWKEIKNDWEKGESLFSKSEIEVIAKVNIRSTGTVYKTGE